MSDSNLLTFHFVQPSLQIKHCNIILKSNFLHHDNLWTINTILGYLFDSSG